jgi:CheY-like chemotaxis protein
LENLVVVIEDDRNLRETIGFILKEERIRTMPAADGMSGLAMIRRHRPKVVLLDMYLPHMSGFELLDDLRNDPILEHIFVIAVTGMAEDSEELGAMRGKADVIMSKPLDEDRLLKLIRNAFEETDDASGLRRHLDGT